MVLELNPEMLALARTSRGLRQTAVAAALGITQPTYSKYETGQVKPRPEYLTKLSHVLDFPQSFFFQTDRVWGTASPHHRKLKSLPKTTLEQLEAQLNIVRLQLRRLTVSVQLDPVFHVPSIDLDDVGTPSEAARQLRRLWRIPSGPIVNVTRVLEDAGVLIVLRPLPAKFDAMSVYGPHESPVILANANFSVERQRQTYAHELGHLVLHESDITANPEQEAHEFAREFLMPADEIRPEMRTLNMRSLPDMKRRWRCSMRNIVFHAEALGELTKPRARYLFIKLNQEFGAQREPFDSPPEPPTLMRELIDRYTNELGYSLDDLVDLAKASSKDFREWHGLRERHLWSL